MTSLQKHIFSLLSLIRYFINEGLIVTKTKPIIKSYVSSNCKIFLLKVQVKQKLCRRLIETEVETLQATGILLI